MNYKKIDLDTWPRREHYLYYTEQLKIEFNITASIGLGKGTQVVRIDVGSLPGDGAEHRLNAVFLAQLHDLRKQHCCFILEGLLGQKCLVRNFHRGHSTGNGVTHGFPIVIPALGRAAEGRFGQIDPVLMECGQWHEIGKIPLFDRGRSSGADRSACPSSRGWRWYSRSPHPYSCPTSRCSH